MRMEWGQQGPERTPTALDQKENTSEDRVDFYSSSFAALKNLSHADGSPFALDRYRPLERKPRKKNTDNSLPCTPR